jgi:membrane-associated phospholipid phosphatase
MQCSVKADEANARTFLSLDFLHTHERVAIAYFLFLAVLGLIRPLEIWQRVFFVAVPAVLLALLFLETNASRPWSRVTRHWATLGLILAGYWSVGWFNDAPLTGYQQLWLSWDRALLYRYGLQALIESNHLIPYVLETAYLLLYAIPPAALGFVYATGDRKRANQFLLVLLLGTLPAYALLPLLPVNSPRLEFPGEDLPRLLSLPRTVNTWVLDHLDISTSVFPSGHVATAFSCAFGLLSVMRQRRLIWSAAFFIASMVYSATVYGRYHYAVDGLASIVICFIAWRLAERWSLQ